MRQIDGTEALERVRELGQSATEAEKRLWSAPRDRRRDEALAKESYRVLRFWNNEVMEELEGVLTAIREALLARVPSPSHPAARDGSLPLPERERVQ